MSNSNINSNSYSMRFPGYNGHGLHHFAMWVIKFNAYLASQGLVPILSANFKDSLSDAETVVLSTEIANIGACLMSDDVTVGDKNCVQRDCMPNLACVTWGVMWREGKGSAKVNDDGDNSSIMLF